MQVLRCCGHAFLEDLDVGLSTSLNSDERVERVKLGLWFSDGMERGRCCCRLLEKRGKRGELDPKMISNQIVSLPSSSKGQLRFEDHNSPTKASHIPQFQQSPLNESRMPL